LFRPVLHCRFLKRAGHFTDQIYLVKRNFLLLDFLPDVAVEASRAFYGLAE
jgi:hypothetical protein